MDIGEIISAAAPHGAENSECPFCPSPEGEDFTTYPGRTALGTTLGEIMVEPTQLPSKQSGCRPKDGNTNRQNAASSKERPNPPLSHPAFGAYSYEAHHLIPGKQKLLKKSGDQKVMDGHPIEKWICAGEKIEGDTGYSINNSDNGAWLASAPESVKKLRGRKPTRPWERERHPKPHPDALTPEEKDEIAFYAMDHSAGQFHYGKHDVADDTGAHQTYPKTVSKLLTQLENRVSDWSQECPLCGEKPTEPPYKPTWMMNEFLDLISMAIEIEIRLMPPKTWEYFISSFAKRRHMQECQHVSSL